jgi:hypothetical protein
MSFKIFFCAERNSGEVREGYSPFSKGASIYEYRKKRKKNCLWTKVTID